MVPLLEAEIMPTHLGASMFRAAVFRETTQTPTVRGPFERRRARLGEAAAATAGEEALTGQVPQLLAVRGEREDSKRPVLT